MPQGRGCVQGRGRRGWGGDVPGRGRKRWEGEGVKGEGSVIAILVRTQAFVAGAGGGGGDGDVHGMKGQDRVEKAWWQGRKRRRGRDTG